MIMNTGGGPLDFYTTSISVRETRDVRTLSGDLSLPIGLSSSLSSSASISVGNLDIVLSLLQFSDSPRHPSFTASPPSASPVPNPRSLLRSRGPQAGGVDVDGGEDSCVVAGIVSSGSVGRIVAVSENEVGSCTLVVSGAGLGSGEGILSRNPGEGDGGLASAAICVDVVELRCRGRAGRCSSSGSGILAAAESRGSEGSSCTGVELSSCSSPSDEWSVVVGVVGVSLANGWW